MVIEIVADDVLMQLPELPSDLDNAVDSAMDTLHSFVGQKDTREALGTQVETQFEITFIV